MNPEKIPSQAFDPEHSPTVRRLAALSRGEIDAADRLYQHVEARILRAVTAKMGPHLMARIDPQDLKQEVLRRSLARVREFGPDQRNQLWAWFHRLAEEVVIDEARRWDARKRDARREVRLDQDSGCREIIRRGGTVWRKVSRKESSAKIEEAMQQLPPKDREVLEIQIQSRVRMSGEELARALGCTPQAASMRASRAAARLRELLCARGVLD